MRFFGVRVLCEHDAYALSDQSYGPFSSSSLDCSRIAVRNQQVSLRRDFSRISRVDEFCVEVLKLVACYLLDGIGHGFCVLKSKALQVVSKILSRNEST